MVKLSINKELRDATQLILNCKKEYGLMKNAVDRMYQVFLEFTDVDISDQNAPDILLSSGIALAPAPAAHCLLEMTRTAIFLRGINQAIKEKLKQKQNLQILYAGCGPYATLITPLLTLYSADELTVDIIDINEISLNSAKAVIDGLGMDDYIGDYLLEDATEMKLTKDYDIVISETMQATLKNEPQVAIMQNMAQQINSQCVFIPQEINVDAKLNAGGKRNAETLVLENEKRIELGEILKVNISNALEPFEIKKVKIENVSRKNQWELKLYTTIKVFKNHKLTEGNCSLNLPKKIKDFYIESIDEIDFWYDQSIPVTIKHRFKAPSNN